MTAVYENGPSTGTSLAAQWLQLHSCTAGAVGSIPGGGTNSLHSQKIEKKKHACVYTHASLGMKLLSHRLFKGSASGDTAK